MSHHNPPDTIDIQDSRRESRLFGQIVTLSSPAQILGPTGSFTSGPIIPPVMTTILPRRSITYPTTERVNVPGLVTSPRTPENPRRYAVTPRPSPIVEIDDEEESPLPAQAFETDAAPPVSSSGGEQADPFWPPRPFPGQGPPGGEPSGPPGHGPPSPPAGGPPGPPAGRPPGPPGGGPPGSPGGGPPGGGPPGPPGGGPPRRPDLINPDGQVNDAEANRVLLDTALTFRDVLLAFGQQVNAPRSARSNLRAPDTFDGSDPSKLAPFLTSCYLHFSERPQDFSTDDDKIFYIISYLRGSAQLWFSPNLYNTAVIPAWDGNFPLFIQELSLNFGPHDPVGDAEDKLRLCRMKTGDRIATYIIAFDQLALLTDFGDSALRHQFYEGLPRRIKDDMIHHSYVNNLTGVKNVARLIDARYWKRETEKERERDRERSSGGGGSGTGGSGSNTSSGRPGQQQGKKGKTSSGQQSSGQQSTGQQSSGNSSSQPEKKKKPYADKLDPRGKIKQEERDRRKKNNLCMYCGGGGHTAENCKKRPADQQQASGKAATTAPSATPQVAPANPEK
jgi:hypothetical protein